MKTRPQTVVVTATGAIALLASAMFASAQLRPTSTRAERTDRPSRSADESRKDSRRGAPIPTARPRRERPVPPDTPRTGGGGRPIDFPTEYREIGGTGNNAANPAWGSVDVELLRMAPAEYADGASEPSGASRVSARAISNACAAQGEPVSNERGASDMLWQWGQFLDHDIDLTHTIDPAEPFDIPVPAGDPHFDPAGTGTQVIGLNRSFYNEVDGVRQQVNSITAFIDASNVYGSDEERAFALRTLDGTGRLKTSEGGLLPFNVDGLDNAPSGDIPTFFLAGDVRANEQAALAAMHTLFVREHNYWATTLGQADASLSGEQRYQMARVIVAAEMQAITFREFLPVLLGRDAIPEYRGYREEVNPGIANVFSTAAYRLGHSMLSSQLLRIDAEGEEIGHGHLALADAFFNPSRIVDEGGIDPLLRGIAANPCQEIDTLVVDDVRNFLFGPPGAGGFDLASLNIQRGRDHGLASYNAVRRAYGLPPVRNLREINRDPDVRARLAAVYSDIDDMDVWVAGLAEAHAQGAMVGATFRAILVDQFVRLRDGDRFWYKRYLPRSLVRLVEHQTLAAIMRRNTGIGDELQDNVFLAP